MRDLPPLPSAVAKVLQLTGSDSSRSTELEKYIVTDQAISTKVLRVVNSPYFGLSGQVSSISQAVIILGFDQIRNLVLSLNTAKLFESKSPEVKRMHVALWQHAFAMATAAQTIGRRKRMDHKELDFLFSGGMMSNTGGLFLAAQFAKPYAQIFARYESTGQPLAMQEQAAFGTDHAEIGQQLCVAWKFPEQLTFLIGRHEGPFAGDPIPTLYAVHAADRIASAMGRNQPLEEPIEHIDPLVREWLRMTEDEIRKVREETKQKLESAADMLGLFG